VQKLVTMQGKRTKEMATSKEITRKTNLNLEKKPRFIGERNSKNDRGHKTKKVWSCVQKMVVEGGGGGGEGLGRVYGGSQKRSVGETSRRL